MGKDLATKVFTYILRYCWLFEVTSIETLNFLHWSKTFPIMHYEMRKDSYGDYSFSFPRASGLAGH